MGETLSRYEKFQIGSGMWWISILTAVVVVFMSYSFMFEE